MTHPCSTAHKEKLVCLCVCVRVGELCASVLCVCVCPCVSLGGKSKALYIMAKEQLCVEWSVDESSKVEGQSNVVHCNTPSYL